MIWVERGGNSLGREVWVENDAGEETHTVAAPLVDGQQVVRIKWQTVSRNEYQHMRRNNTGGRQYLLALRTDKHKVARKDYTLSCLGSEIEGRTS